MPPKKKLLAIAVAVAATLAGCGGGDPSSQSLTPDAAIRDLRVRAQVPTASAVTPQQAAEQLMDAAESAPAYRQYFPQHETTQSAGPFAYRYYPDTGVYLGVVVTAGTAYGQVGAIYVIGGPFGGSIQAPVPEGVVTDYITPVAPTPVTAAANNGCFDLNAAFTAGNHTVVSYQYGNGTDHRTDDTTVGSGTSFNGFSATAVTAHSTGFVTGQTLDITTTTYLARTGDAQTTEYGMTLTGPGVPDVRSVYSPAYVDPMPGLAVGQSATATMAGTDSFTVNGTPQSSSYTDSFTITYVGHETVTVPAGTYDTCRFDTSYGGTQAPASEWFIAGKGILVKSVSGSDTTQATSVQLNGQAL